MEVGKISSVNKVSDGSYQTGQRVKAADTRANTEQDRPAKRVSSGGSELFSSPNFTGNPKLVTNIVKEGLNSANNVDIPSWAQKMGGAGWFDKVLTSVNKNETFYEAMTALVVAGVLKPACVLAMPGAEMEDKQMSATKNAVSAAIGFGLSNLLLSPVSNGTNRVLKSIDGDNPTKYIKDLKYVNALKNEDLLPGKKSTLKEAFKTTYKKFPDLGVSPLKASVTIALTPIILKLLFGKSKKKDNAKKPVENHVNKMQIMNSIKTPQMQKNTAPIAAQSGADTTFNGIMQNDGFSFADTAAFKNNAASSPSFTGAADTVSLSSAAPLFADNAAVKTGLPSFTGGVNQIIDIAQEAGQSAAGAIKKGKGAKTLKDAYDNLLGEPIAKFIGRISDKKPCKKLVETTANWEKPSARWSDLASVAITYFYVQNTAKSKTMDEDRKLPLMINNVMVTAASSTAAFLIDKYTDKPMENLLRGYLKKHDAEMFNESNKNIVKTVKKALDNGKDTVDLTALKHHSNELLEGGLDNASENLKASIKALSNNEYIKKAVKENIIENDDIAKMAASGYEKLAKSVYGSISKAKSLTVFTFTVRFLVTVLMTPVIGRVVALVNKKLGKNPDAAQKAIVNAPPPGSETIGMKDYINGLSN